MFPNGSRIFLLLTGLLIGARTFAGPGVPEAVPRLTVMTFNVWHEGRHVHDGVRKAVAAIRESGADLVGLQESSNTHAQALADALGWTRVPAGSGTAQIISRYPVVESFPVPGVEDGRAVGARLRVSVDPRREVVFFDVHLDYEHYGPYAARAPGATVTSVLAEENQSRRSTQIAAVLLAMAPFLARADETPVLLTGDFNAPSHLDWTAATAAAHHGVGPVPWPATARVAAAGLVDSFRTVHPDPVKDPGTSWSAVQRDPEPQDRIDFVFQRGRGLRPVSSHLFATAVEVTLGAWGGDLAPIVDNTWPTDHFAVITAFAWEPALAGSPSVKGAEN